MDGLLVALGFASALTAMFAFRFPGTRKPRILVAYFVIFGTLESIAHVFFIEEGAIPVETAFVLFGITALFGIAIMVVSRMEKQEDR